MIIVTLWVFANYGDYVMLAVFAAGAAGVAYGVYTRAIDVVYVILGLLFGYAIFQPTLFRWRRKRPSRGASKNAHQTLPAAQPPKRYSDAEFKAAINTRDFDDDDARTRGERSAPLMLVKVYDFPPKGFLWQVMDNDRVRTAGTAPSQAEAIAAGNAARKALEDAYR
jgi:hypothetical protein